MKAKPKVMKAMKMKAKPKVMKTMKMKVKPILTKQDHIFCRNVKAGKMKFKPLFMKRTLSFCAVPDIATMPDLPPRDGLDRWTYVMIRFLRTDAMDDLFLDVPTRIVREFIKASNSHKLFGAIYAIESKVFTPWMWANEGTPSMGEVISAKFLKPLPVISLLRAG